MHRNSQKGGFVYPFRISILYLSIFYLRFKEIQLCIVLDNGNFLLSIPSLLDSEIHQPSISLFSSFLSPHLIEFPTWFSSWMKCCSKKNSFIKISRCYYCCYFFTTFVKGFYFLNEKKVRDLISYFFFVVSFPKKKEWDLHSWAFRSQHVFQTYECVCTICFSVCVCVYILKGTMYLL